MKKKILGVLSVVMLSGAILLGGQSMDAEAAKNSNTNDCRHWNKGTITDFSYPYADNYKHKEQVRVFEFCYDCPDYIRYRNYEHVENHSCPNNNECKCGFKPPCY